MIMLPAVHGGASIETLKGTPVVWRLHLAFPSTSSTPRLFRPGLCIIKPVGPILWLVPKAPIQAVFSQPLHL